MTPKRLSWADCFYGLFGVFLLCLFVALCFLCVVPFNTN